MFGRNPNRSDTIFSQNDISNVHGTIQWNGKDWLLLDHSRNGIRLNNKIIQKSPSRISLTNGDTIAFGKSHDTHWTVENTHAPTTMLIALEGDQSIPLSTQQLLPNSDHPEVAIFLTSSGEWFLESETSFNQINDGEVLEIANKLWRFQINSPLDITANTINEEVNPTPPQLEFQASLDEEHVELTVTTEKQSVYLGERVHHYCLLLLARKRFADAQNGYDELSQGWLELSILAKMMGLTASHINIQVFRARNQLLKALPKMGQSDFIERRRNELRIGNLPFKIYRSKQLECHFNALSNQLSVPC